MEDIEKPIIIYNMVKKTCSKCKEEKEVSEFHKHCYSNGGYRSKCKKCRSRPRPPIIVDGKKKCPKCGLIKELSEYYNDNNTKTGISTRCKECVKSHVRKWKTENPEIEKAMREKYVAENREEINRKGREWSRKNKHKAKEYRKNNPPDKERRRITAKKYRDKNRKELRVKWAAYRRKRIKNDVEFRVLAIMRGRVRSALNAKPGNRHKYHSTKILVGTTIKKLIKHLESQFIDGMSWDNYGLHGWHIDHIKPCASFDLTCEDQQKECFHYTNLQPLWAEDNLKKGDRY